MKPTRKLSRRSFLGRVAGGALVSAAAITVVTDEASAQSGCSDSDSGRYGDPGGNGRRCRRRTGCSDRDPSDPVNFGRRCGGRPSGCSDRDPSDPVGRGRRCGARPSGCSDRDPNDPVGRGRHCGRRRSCTDRDTGRYSDPVGRGRRC
jgi:hypothetical protein